jgi:hypothetical protein
MADKVEELKSKVKPKIEVEVIKETHGPHDLGVIKRINPKNRQNIEIEKAPQGVVEYPEVANKLKELETLLYNLKYNLAKCKKCFDLLCFLHNYISHNKNDFISKNKFADILHALLIEIFMPIKAEEPYKPYTGKDEGNRVHFMLPGIKEIIDNIYTFALFILGIVLLLFKSAQEIGVI